MLLYYFTSFFVGQCHRHWKWCQDTEKQKQSKNQSVIAKVKEKCDTTTTVLYSQQSRVLHPTVAFSRDLKRTLLQYTLSLPFALVSLSAAQKPQTVLVFAVSFTETWDREGERWRWVRGWWWWWWEESRGCEWGKSKKTKWASLCRGEASSFAVVCCLIDHQIIIIKVFILKWRWPPAQAKWHWQGRTQALCIFYCASPSFKKRF